MYNSVRAYLFFYALTEPSRIPQDQTSKPIRSEVRSQWRLRPRPLGVWAIRNRPVPPGRRHTTYVKWGTLSPACSPPGWMFKHCALPLKCDIKFLSNAAV